MKCSLINYFDVWGNKKDGWWVNDQCCENDDLFIPHDATNKDICRCLVELNMLKTSDMRRLEVIDWGDLIEIYERKTGRPLYALHIKD